MICRRATGSRGLSHDGMDQQGMDQQTCSSAAPFEQTPTDEFASLAQARAYIDTIRERVSSFATHESVEVLDRLDSAYRQFPELLLDRSRGELVEGLRFAAKDLPTRLEPTCSGSVTSFDDRSSLSSISHLSARRPEVPWGTIKPIVAALRRQNRADKILEVISALLDSIKFTEEESVSDLQDILTLLLSDEPRPESDSDVLAKAVLSARHRLNPSPSRRNKLESREALLAMAERLRAAPPPQRSAPHPDLAWLSGWMSFDEFLLQWPCEIELPFDLDDVTFIEEAYRAILLRGPEAGDTSQYLRLLRNGVVSKEWVVEDLCESEELRSLERRLRVIWGGHVITGPGEDEMPAVTWPWRSPTDG